MRVTPAHGWRRACQESFTRWFSQHCPLPSSARPLPRVDAVEAWSDPGALRSLRELLLTARKPFVIAGGGGWTPQAAQALQRFAENWKLPVGNAFRFQDTFDNHHPQYAGDVGIGINPKLAARIRESDLILAIGPRLGEMSTSGYTLLMPPKAKQKLVQQAESRYIRDGCNDDARAGRPLTRACQLIARDVLDLREQYAQVSQSVETANAVAQQREAILQEMARFGCNAGSSATFTQERQDIFDRIFGTTTENEFTNGDFVDGGDYWGYSGFSTVRTNPISSTSYRPRRMPRPITWSERSTNSRTVLSTPAVSTSLITTVGSLACA